MHDVAVSPDVVSKHIVITLKQHYSLRFTLKPVLRDLNRRFWRKTIGGYKIQLSGRFTRKLRTLYQYHRKGRLSPSDLNFSLRYSLSLFYFKYGVCGVKVWISYPNYLKKAPNSFFQIESIFYNNFNLFRNSMNSFLNFNQTGFRAINLTSLNRFFGRSS